MTDIKEINENGETGAELEVRTETHLAELEEPKFFWKKIKIAGDCLEAKYQRRMPGGIIHDFEHGSNGLVHGDLRDAFQKLAKHVAMLSDSSESVEIKMRIEAGEDFSETPISITDDIKVTGIVLTGDAEPEGIMIIAQKRIGPKVMNILTPLLKFDEDQFYRYMEELQVDIDQIEYEANLYVFEGKYAEKQLSLDFDNPDDQDEGGDDE